MNMVERVKELCKSRNIAISKLERECGFANGYIGKLREGTMPADRLYVVANYLDVPIERLITGKDDLGISNDELGLLAIIRMLNRNGFLKVLEYAEMLVRLDEYQKGEELSDLNGSEVIA